MNPPAYEHIALELAFSAATAARATVVTISTRDSINIDEPTAEEPQVLYEIVQRRQAVLLTTPFRPPDLTVTHVPSGNVVGTVKIRRISKSRELVFPRTKQCIRYIDSFVSPHGNGNVHWYLAAPTYDSGSATVELRRANKHRTPICRVVMHGGLGKSKNGTIDVMDYRGQQEALDEIVVSTAAEIWDPHGKGQGDGIHQVDPKPQARYSAIVD